MALSLQGRSLDSAAEIRVSPGQSLQEAVDGATEGDTIIVEPGTYTADSSSEYGLEIRKNGIRLVGEPTSNEKVILHYVPGSSQQVGILAAPNGCEWNTPGGENGCIPGQPITNILISGITVQGFPRHGIQTRCVDLFEYQKCESIDNLGNGLYPTLSTNGLVQNSVSHGSLDAALWPVRVQPIENRSTCFSYYIFSYQVVWMRERDTH